MLRHTSRKTCMSSPSTLTRRSLRTSSMMKRWTKSLHLLLYWCILSSFMEKCTREQPLSNISLCWLRDSASSRTSSSRSNLITIWSTLSGLLSTETRFWLMRWVDKEDLWARKIQILWSHVYLSISTIFREKSPSQMLNSSSYFKSESGSTSN